MFWLRCWSWSVLALFETSVVAFDVAVCVALLGPEETFPPAIETGTFAFTAFWSLSRRRQPAGWSGRPGSTAWNPPAPPAERTGTAADVLVQRLVWSSCCSRRRCWPRSPFCVASSGQSSRCARDRNRDVGVHCVLVAVGDPGCQLVGLGVLDSGLESTRATTAGVTTQLPPMFWFRWSDRSWPCSRRQ
jgi:hypothetical protein